ncbi:hypothetical protein L1987_11324 [Smallanthus sonchifolius]|uniref:Uncharacterized protein n=1 Tax=Smallanthus sonchifolius TaxID=185202 RepID=A0ACB9JB49_9ASTR|nr:hypothetical protein L1987_11324 [Smallanthus sonchifolius]
MIECILLLLKKGYSLDNLAGLSLARFQPQVSDYKFRIAHNIVNQHMEVNFEEIEEGEIKESTSLKKQKFLSRDPFDHFGSCIIFPVVFTHFLLKGSFQEENGASTTSNKSKKMKLINARLRKINKPFVKSIKSPDGDIIDCVLFHLQPAFDLPELRGKMLLHAIGYVTPGEFYGAKAILNVWEPNVTGYDFSLSQIWVIADVPTRPVNTVEAGWHIYPNVHKDSLPRLFTYWTPDGYRSGCYNMVCPGFVQTNQKVCLGAAIDPISTYNGQQYDVAFMISKDPKNGDWWLTVRSEVRDLGRHTSTQMGSGHFQDEGFGKAAYARNLEVVDEDNKLNAVYDLQLLADNPNCYGVKNGYSDAWGNYIYFGGPGYNPNCL